VVKATAGPYSKQQKSLSDGVPCMKAFDYAAPATLAEAVALFAARGERARALAGGTDVIVQVREGRRDLDMLIDVKNIPELNELAFDRQRGLRFGAAVPCYRLCEHADLARSYPGLIEAAGLIGGTQIQSRASVGGNLCNASPAADTIPALIAAEAVCIIAGPEGRRELPVEAFCTAPGRTALRRGELLVRLHVPPPRPHTGSAYLRFIPRNEMDIAVVGVGAQLTLDDRHAGCVAARIALAAVAPTPLFVPDAGAALIGRTPLPADIERAAALAQAAARPISDMRGDADYRRHLVGVLTRRALTLALARSTEN
jgi:xanthine dehydrogenase FAD-binding subunit